jgi:hypothetical protein
VLCRHRARAPLTQVVGRLNSVMDLAPLVTLLILVVLGIVAWSKAKTPIAG